MALATGGEMWHNNHHRRGTRSNDLETYRSGHNGADSKTATLQPSAKPAKALVFKGFGLI